MSAAAATGPSNANHNGLRLRISAHDSLTGTSSILAGTPDGQYKITRDDSGDRPRSCRAVCLLLYLAIPVVWATPRRPRWVASRLIRAKKGIGHGSLPS